MLSTTTANGESTEGATLILLGVTASSTQGYLDLLIYNATGAVFTWPMGDSTIGTGTASYLSGN